MNPFNIPVSALSNTDTLKTDHLHEFNYTSVNLHSTLAGFQVDLVKHFFEKDSQLREHIKNLSEVIRLIQDLIEAKEKSK